MTNHGPPPFERPQERRLRIPGAGVQAIAGNPLTDAEVEMFEMFNRENWLHHRRREYIMEIVQRRW